MHGIYKTPSQKGIWKKLGGKNGGWGWDSTAFSPTLALQGFQWLFSFAEIGDQIKSEYGKMAQEKTKWLKCFSHLNWHY